MTDQTTADAGRIIVGVDGSPGSKAALRWAMGQARLTGAAVEAIATWQDPAASGYAYGWVSVPTEGDSLAVITQKVVDETVAEVSGQVENPVHVQTLAVQGHPAQILVKASEHAQLMVVGTRGHGTFAGILLGSVSQHCVQHSACPVVVIPTPEPAAAA